MVLACPPSLLGLLVPRPPGFRCDADSQAVLSPWVTSSDSASPEPPSLFLQGLCVLAFWFLKTKASPRLENRESPRFRPLTTCSLSIIPVIPQLHSHFCPVLAVTQHGVLVYTLPVWAPSEQRPNSLILRGHQRHLPAPHSGPQAPLGPLSQSASCKVPAGSRAHAAAEHSLAARTSPLSASLCLADTSLNIANFQWTSGTDLSASEGALKTLVTWAGLSARSPADPRSA